jgi:HK97 family phage major capsid protein
MVYNAVLTRGAGPTYSPTPGTHPLIPEDVSREIIKSTTNKSAVLEMFKHRTMSTAQQRMPVLATKPTAYFVTGDTGLKQTTSISWTNKFLDAEELAVIVPVPEKLLDDVDYDIWGEIRPEIIEAMGIALDAAILFGYNKPASWPASIAAAAIAAGNTVVQGTGIDVADDLNATMAAVEIDGFDVNGFFIRTQMKAELRGLRDLNQAFIFQPVSGVADTVYKGTIFGEKAVSSTSGIWEAEDQGTYGRTTDSVKAIAGDFSQGLVGIRQDLTWKMLDQSVITDAAGLIVFNLPQQDMVAMRVVARYAFQVPNPLNRMNLNEATRYPFAVLQEGTVIP